MVSGVGFFGCGIESQMESWYRFLIQPDPYQSLGTTTGNVAARACLRPCGTASTPPSTRSVTTFCARIRSWRSSFCPTRTTRRSTFGRSGASATTSCARAGIRRAGRAFARRTHSPRGRPDATPAASYAAQDAKRSVLQNGVCPGHIGGLLLERRRLGLRPQLAPRSHEAEVRRRRTVPDRALLHGTHLAARTRPRPTNIRLAVRTTWAALYGDLRRISTVLTLLYASFSDGAV